MAKNITTATTTTIASGLDGVLVTVNAALTGTIQVTVGGITIGTITNPTVGNFFRYGGLRGQGSVQVVTNASCDITVSPIEQA